MTKNTLTQAIAQVGIIGSGVFVGAYALFLVLNVSGSVTGAGGSLSGAGCSSGTCGGNASADSRSEAQVFHDNNLEEFLSARAQRSVANNPLHGEMRVQRRINTLFPELQSLAEIEPLGDDSGLFKVDVAGEVFLISQDGNYIINHSYVDMSEVHGPNDSANIVVTPLTDYDAPPQANNESSTQDVTERPNNMAQQEEVIEPGLAGAWDFFTSESIHYPATTDSRHELVVFADVNCPACRAFHEQYGQLNAQGVDIHVALLSISGRDGRGVSAANSIMCSDDPKGYYENIITRRDMTQPPRNECNEYAQNAFDAAMMLEIKGTPGLWLNGVQVTNMREVHRLVQ